MQDIEESIRIILSPAKGERVMRPDFGCGIRDLVFAPRDATTVGLAKIEVRDALMRFEPRIELLDVDVSRADDADRRILVSIDYRVRATNNYERVVYAFDL